jgi:glycosyltransferase involved in cell wall biosynthesis
MSTTDDFKDNFVVVHQGSEQPEISVVMPIYNCEQFVETAVTSVLEQEQVVAEIIISDDASTDATFALAYKTVVDYINTAGLKHTVLMRIGTARLMRDHLHLLAKQAACDLVCQAHGDDISHITRCSVLVKAFNDQAKNASMIFVSALVIDPEGKVLWQPKNMSLSDVPMVPVEYEKVIEARDELLIGSNMAWRQSAFEDFPQLTTAYCAYGHDRVMTFRSFLLGNCYILDAPLMARRLHAKNFHKELTSSDDESVNSFNTQLIRLCLFSAMKNDLIFFKQHNQIDSEKYGHYLKDIDNSIIQINKFLTVATNDLASQGYINTWVK